MIWEFWQRRQAALYGDAPPAAALDDPPAMLADLGALLARAKG